MANHTIFSRFLSELGVPHTDAYSDEEFRGMTFKSLYGLSHLLKIYNIRNMGVRFQDKSKISTLETPFLAQTRSGVFVIVTRLDLKSGKLEYDSLGDRLTISLENFMDAWNGIALLAFPDGRSREPDYESHRLTEMVAASSKYALATAALVVVAYFFITRQLYANISTVLIAIFDCIGLYFSFLLLQKSLNIHTAASDRVCGVLEQGGCDSIMRTKASKLFGVFAWSEIGFGYFGVSLATLLMFPHIWPDLALCNLLCLPYTAWSIWYQKFSARHWCTLCVGVQTTLWLLFFCYLGGGWLAQSLPLRANFFILAAVYVFTVLFLNMLLAILKNLPCHENNTRT